MFNKLSEMMEGLKETLEPISKFFYIVTHPRVIFDWIIGISYWLAVLICIASLIYYIGTKSRKSLQILNITIITYILLKAISAVV